MEKGKVKKRQKRKVYTLVLSATLAACAVERDLYEKRGRLKFIPIIK
jgi:hypothetical protein